MIVHQLHRLADHVYYLSADSSSDRPVLGAISGTTGTLVVKDAGRAVDLHDRERPMALPAQSPAHTRLRRGRRGG